MPLDILAFREEKSNVELVRENLRRRYKDVKIVDEIQALDKKWRELVFKKDNLKKEASQISKAVGQKKKAKEPVDDLMAQVKAMKIETAGVEDEIDTTMKQRDALIGTVGNFVHDSVPVSNNEDDNEIVRTHGEFKQDQAPKLHHHHELLHMIDGYASKQGVTVAGHRGYFLKGVGVMLNQALINYGLSFLMAKKYTPLQPPYFMKKPIMAETAQLEQFDEELYKVTGKTDGDNDDDEWYLIATSEQPISAYHRQEWIPPTDLPLRYAGYSTCFRKEAGSHGKDAWGIFRIHQFEKIEQFCLVGPEDSWEEHHQMIKIAEEFYKSLGLSYRVVNIVSGALNNAAAKKFDLEAWFPTLGCFRELVSSSNCTDYQSRAMETRYGQKKLGEKEKSYCHMLNATLCATERTICCLLENYQCEEGVRVPEVLRPFMGGMEIMPFVKECPVNITQKKQKAAAQKKAK